MDNSSLVKSKIIDKINKYKQSGEVQATNFLDPLEIIDNASLYKNMPHILIGGKEDAERKRLIVGIDEIDELSKYISIIKVESQEILNHRNVLGSVLGLGLKRDVLGDITIDKNIAYLFCEPKIGKYILDNLKQVGREKVKVSIASAENLDEVEITLKEQNLTLASLRLDSAISECYGLSRAISAKLIEAEKVKLNYRITTSSSKQIKKGDLISVRGYGRFTIEEVIGETRKGRIRVTIKRT